MSTHAEQARAYVVGGLDYTLTPLMRDVLVQHLARRGRCDLAAAIPRGWVEQRPEPAGPTAWHRLIGDVAAEVGAA